jgi:hypothetical protein
VQSGKPATVTYANATGRSRVVYVALPAAQGRASYELTLGG